MSRSDKDVPWFVHVAREGIDQHDHRFGLCDFEPRYRRGETIQLSLSAWRYRRPCGLDMRDGPYCLTRSGEVGWWAHELQARDRARVRRHAKNVIKLYNAGESVDDYDVPCPQNRSSAKWEAW